MIKIQKKNSFLKIPGMSQSKMLSQKLMPPNGRGYFSSNSSHSKYNIPRLATDVSVYGCLFVNSSLLAGSANLCLVHLSVVAN